MQGHFSGSTVKKDLYDLMTNSHDYGSQSSVSDVVANLKVVQVTSLTFMMVLAAKPFNLDRRF